MNRKKKLQFNLNYTRITLDNIKVHELILHLMSYRTLREWRNVNSLAEEAQKSIRREMKKCENPLDDMERKKKRVVAIEKTGLQTYEVVILDIISEEINMVTVNLEEEDNMIVSDNNWNNQIVTDNSEQHSLLSGTIHRRHSI